FIAPVLHGLDRRRLQHLRAADSRQILDRAFFRDDGVKDHGTRDVGRSGNRRIGRIGARDLETGYNTARNVGGTFGGRNLNYRRRPGADTTHHTARDTAAATHATHSGDTSHRRRGLFLHHLDIFGDLGWRLQALIDLRDNLD